MYIYVEFKYFIVYEYVYVFIDVISDLHGYILGSAYVKIINIVVKTHQKYKSGIYEGVQYPANYIYDIYTYINIYVGYNLGTWIKVNIHMVVKYTAHIKGYNIKLNKCR